MAMTRDYNRYRETNGRDYLCYRSVLFPADSNNRDIKKYTSKVMTYYPELKPEDLAGKFLAMTEGNGYRAMCSNSFYDIEYAPEDLEEDKTASEFSSKASLEILKKQSPFEYRMLSRIRIIETDLCPSACIFFDKYSRRFIMEISPKFVKFLTSAYLPKRVPTNVVGAMLIDHELQHMLRSHVVKDGVPNKHHELDNLCQDLFINNDITQVCGNESYLPMGVFREVPINGIAKKNCNFSAIFDVFRKAGLFKHTWDHSYQVVYKKGDMIDFKLHLTQYADMSKELREALLEVERKYIESVSQNAMSGAPSMDEGYQYSDETLDGDPQVREATLEELQEIIQTALSESTERDKHCSTAKICAEVERPAVCIKGHEQTWREVLRRHVRQGLNSKEVYKVNSPNARVESQLGRDEDVPSIKTLTFAIDVSGSMGINDYDECIAEVKSVIKALGLKQLKLNVIWWGSSVRIEKFNSISAFNERCKKSTPSLGGTEPRLAIREMDKIKSDCQIIMTDGWFYEYSDPKLKTLWFITSNGTRNNIHRNKKNIVVQPERK